MRYFKNLTDGAVVKGAEMPVGKWWRDATEREYNAYRARVTRAVGSLEKAVAYKTSLLKV